MQSKLEKGFVVSVCKMVVIGNVDVYSWAYLIAGGLGVVISQDSMEQSYTLLRKGVSSVFSVCHLIKLHPVELVQYVFLQKKGSC